MPRNTSHALAVASLASLASLALVALTACDDTANTATTAAGGASATTVSGSTASTASSSTSSGSMSGDGDFTISPPYAPAPDIIPNDQVPAGTLQTFTMSSTDSVVYPTDFATGQPFTRDVLVYIPQQYVPDSEAPFMVVQDGISFGCGSSAAV